jgi:hypothetical protein
MNVSIPFRPKLAEVLKGCSPGDIQAGSVADITVGIVALPLVMERVNCVLNLPAVNCKGVTPFAFQVGRAPVGSKLNEDRSPRAAAAPLWRAKAGSSVASPHRNCTTASQSRWLPEPDKTDTVGGVQRSSPDHPNSIPKSRVPAVGAPEAGTARKEIPREHAVLEAGAPGMAEPVGR